MAKKKKDTDDNSEEKKGGGVLVSVLVTILIIAIWIAIFCIFVKLDIGNLGSNLRPYLRNIPVINTILPNVTDEQIAIENDYQFNNLVDAIKEIERLNAEIADLNDKLASTGSQDSTVIADLRTELARLRPFEEDAENFKKRVKLFDEGVVFNPKAPDIEAYKAYYESMNPDNAERIYQMVIQKMQVDEGIKNEAALIVLMKPAQAAAFLEESTADYEWIVKVLLAMKPDAAAGIMDKMDPLNVAKIFRKMADMDQEKMDAINAELDAM